MIEMFTGLKPIQTQEEFLEVKRLAKEDQHDVIAPTHLVMKGGKVCGYMSLAAIPVSLVHLYTKDMEALDSFNAINIAECVMQGGGAKFVVTMIGKESPFHKTMINPKMGYKFLASVDLFLKEF